MMVKRGRWATKWWAFKERNGIRRVTGNPMVDVVMRARKRAFIGAYAGPFMSVIAVTISVIALVKGW